MFEPRLAAASLSGESDAEWAASAADHVGAAFLGGLALDDATRDAARAMVARGRDEFLPADPIAFMDSQLDALADVDVRPAFNVRAVTVDALRKAAYCCERHDAILEVNAHCRQNEICTAGGGESLLCDTDRLCEYVAAAAETGVTVSVKVRTEVPNVDLLETAREVAEAGADIVHVDAMDSERVVADVVDAADCFVVANNGVRDNATAREYLSLGADAVSVGRPSDDPEVLARVRASVDEWFRAEVRA